MLQYNPKQVQDQLQNANNEELRQIIALLIAEINKLKTKVGG